MNKKLGFNLTILEHSVISIVLMLIIGFITGNWLAGAMFPIGLFIGREHSEAEYRWMNLHNVNRNGWKETIGAFDPEVWDIGSLLDFIVPILVCSFLLIAFSI